MSAPCSECGKEIPFALRSTPCGECGPRKPTVKLRIRVGVTADGMWMAIGGNIGAEDHDTAFKLGEHVGGCRFIASHWITAEVPMPEVEQGEVAGEVER